MQFLSNLVAKAYAADVVPVISPIGDPNTGGSARATLIRVGNSVLSLLLLLAGILAVFYLVWSGIQYVTAAGDPTKTKNARAGIVSAVIGIIVIVAAYAIIHFAVGLGQCVAGNGNCQSSGGSSVGDGIGNGLGNTINNGKKSTGGSSGSGANNPCPPGWVVVEGPTGQVCIQQNP